jgi:hypothetical protein
VNGSVAAASVRPNTAFNRLAVECLCATPRTPFAPVAPPALAGEAAVVGEAAVDAGAAVVDADASSRDPELPD